MKYFKEAQSIWTHQVPKKGQSETVEGELIRAIEKLRTEAYENGNANWDEAFSYFIEYIWKTLIDVTLFKDEEINEIGSILDRLKAYKQPYLEDDLYDKLADYAVMWSQAKNGPVAREHDPKQYR